MTLSAKRLVTALPLAAALVGAAVYVEGKAGGGRVEAVETRVNAVEVRAARVEERLEWMTSTLWAVAQKVGVIVPPPPRSAP